MVLRDDAEGFQVLLSGVEHEFAGPSVRDAFDGEFYGRVQGGLVELIPVARDGGVFARSHSGEGFGIAVNHVDGLGEFLEDPAAHPMQPFELIRAEIFSCLIHRFKYYLYVNITKKIEKNNS